MDDIWFGDEAVAVDAQFLSDGEVRPTAFTWRGRQRAVVGLGRQWVEADGRHVLVVVPDGSRFELCLNSAQSNWRLLRAWERQSLA